MTDRYPGYDVLAKRWTQSWNEVTRQVIDRRLAVPREPRFFSATEWRTLNAVCDRIMPQPTDRPPVPLPAYVDQKITDGLLDGYRYAQMPPQGEAWRRGLAALDQAARDTHGGPLPYLARRASRTGCCAACSRATLTGEAWGGMPCKLFFEHRVIPDITHAYYAHPGRLERDRLRRSGQPPRLCADGIGPARPVGGCRGQTRRGRHMPGGRTTVSADPFAAPRAANGRAPDVFKRGGWVPMRQYSEDEIVDFVVVGTGAGGGPLIAGLAEGGFSVVGFDAGPYFRPLEDFASDEREQEKLYWTDERVVDGANPITMGGKNSGKAVGGSTVHFAMVSLRFRPEWFKSRSALGYGADWPLDWREMWHYYTKAEKALSISGPLSYPWGPKRPRYPYRAHELNGAAELLARGAEAMGLKWTPTPLATVSAPHGKSPPCVYRGFCRFGCSTNAKQSQLVTFIPRALQAGAEIRDLAMVGRIEMGPDGRATGVHYHREGRWRFQKARNVVVAGYAIETPRLLLASATDKYPDGLANSSGLVGKNLMTQSNQAVFGTMAQEVRWNKGPALARHHRALELRRPQGFRRRLLLDGAGTAAGGMGDDADQLAWPVGPGAARRDGEIQPSGRAEDGRRDAAGRAQPGDAGR